MTYNKETLKNAIVQKLRLNYGCTEQQATDGEMMKACAMVLRDIMAERGVQTREETAHEEKRKVHYLSLEFLMGRSLMKNAFNLELLDELSEKTGMPAPKPLASLRDKEIRFTQTVEKDHMVDAVLGMLE